MYAPTEPNNRIKLNVKEKSGEIAHCGQRSLKRGKAEVPAPQRMNAQAVTAKARNSVLPAAKGSRLHKLIKARVKRSGTAIPLSIREVSDERLSRGIWPKASRTNTAGSQTG